MAFYSSGPDRHGTYIEVKSWYEEGTLTIETIGKDKVGRMLFINDKRVVKELIEALQSYLDENE